MRISDLSQSLLEGKQHPVIVVDVQPAYASYAGKVSQRIIDFVAQQTGPVLMFVNAEDTGVTEDSMVDIRMWWDEYADIDWSRVQMVDKGYGYFRSWMDNGVDPASIIRVVRAMYQQRVSSSDQLFDGVGSEEYPLHMQQLVGDEYEEWMNDGPISIYWANVAQLRKFNGAYLVGGGRNECLREVELLMNAFNIRYKRIASMVY